MAETDWKSRGFEFDLNHVAHADQGIVGGVGSFCV